MNIAPPARHRIIVDFPIGGIEFHAFRSLNEQRRGLVQLFHLRERVPVVGKVYFNAFVQCNCSSASGNLTLRLHATEETMLRHQDTEETTSNFVKITAILSRILKPADFSKYNLA